MIVAGYQYQTYNSTMLNHNILSISEYLLQT